MLHAMPADKNILKKSPKPDWGLGLWGGPPDTQAACRQRAGRINR